MNRPIKYIGTPKLVARYGNVGRAMIDHLRRLAASGVHLSVQRKFFGDVTVKAIPGRWFDVVQIWGGAAKAFGRIVAQATYTGTLSTAFRWFFKAQWSAASDFKQPGGFTYGNIDWTGTLGTLSWWGPPSRYFGDLPVTNAGDPSRFNDPYNIGFSTDAYGGEVFRGQVFTDPGGMFFSETGYVSIGSGVYYPLYRWATGVTGCAAIRLYKDGAAILSAEDLGGLFFTGAGIGECDGQPWVIGVYATRGAAAASIGAQNEVVFAIPLDTVDDPLTAITLHTEAYSEALYAGAFSPWLFSESGAKAVTTRLERLVRLGIDLSGTSPAATFYDDGPAVAESIVSSATRTFTYEDGYAGVAVLPNDTEYDNPTFTCAISRTETFRDYRGEALVVGEMSWSGTSDAAGKFYLMNSPGAFPGDGADLHIYSETATAALSLEIDSTPVFSVSAPGITRSVNRTVVHHQTGDGDYSVSGTYGYSPSVWYCVQLCDLDMRSGRCVYEFVKITAGEISLVWNQYPVETAAEYYQGYTNTGEHVLGDMAWEFIHRTVDCATGAVLNEETETATLAGTTIGPWHLVSYAGNTGSSPTPAEAVELLKRAYRPALPHTYSGGLVLPQSIGIPGGMAVYRHDVGVTGYYLPDDAANFRYLSWCRTGWAYAARQLSTDEGKALVISPRFSSLRALMRHFYPNGLDAWNSTTRPHIRYAEGLSVPGGSTPTEVFDARLTDKELSILGVI